jgi:hypothetical protein
MKGDICMSELTDREQRAQEGVLQFAEEMQAIRGDGKPVDDGGSALYPNAGKKDAWKTYCGDRWGMSPSYVGRVILAAPVIGRMSETVGLSPNVSSAATVATLPIPVQDAILADTPKRDVVKARAKAARKVEKRAKRHEVEADSAEMIREAMAAKPAKPTPKEPPMPDHLRAENLPPRLRPEDHGWAPRKLAGDALLALWRANEKLEDSIPPTEEDRRVMVEKVEKITELAPVVLAKLRGESTISDDDLYALMERET